MRRKIFFSLLIFLLAGFLYSPAFFVDQAQAASASLLISPSTGNFSVGNKFTAKILVNSGGGNGINAAEGALKYNPAYLKVDSVSKGSIFSLWTQDPVFSNSAGTISFGGGSPSAYKGSTGVIVTVVFTVLKAGDTDVSFTSGLVLANDGMGTNILSGMSSAKYSVAAAVVTPVTPVATTTTPQETKKPVTAEPKTEEKGILPPAPEVVSTTHPKEDVWYPNNNPEFKWKLLADVIAVSVLITDKADSDPGNDSEGVIESKSFDNIKNGAWWIHAKFKNKFGWSQITHRKFQIDSEAPEMFVIKIDDKNDPTNPTPVFDFETFDKVSGIDRYKLNINGETKELTTFDFKKNPYVSTILPPGDNQIDVVAFDKAGNAASTSRKFIVEPLKMPIISDMPKTLISGKEDLIIRGTSFYPQATVKVFIGKVGKDPEITDVQTDAEGNWSFFSKKKYDIGDYEVWTQLVDNRGAQSFATNKNILVVIKPSIIQAYGWLIILILFIAVLVELASIITMRIRFIEERIRIKKETEETKNVVQKVFHALKEELDEQLEFADNRKGLSESERRVKERLQDALDVAQEFIDKEIADTQKEINLKIKER